MSFYLAVSPLSIYDSVCTGSLTASQRPVTLTDVALGLIDVGASITITTDGKEANFQCIVAPESKRALGGLTSVDITALEGSRAGMLGGSVNVRWASL